MTLLRMLSFHSNAVQIEVPAKKKTPEKPLTPESKPKVSNVNNKAQATVNVVQEPQAAQQTSYTTLNINTQQEWEALTKTLEFSTAARTLLKNTIFKNANAQSLTLSLDEAFSTLLTKSIQGTILDTLRTKFGDITLNISLNKLKTQTLAQKETQASNKKIAALQKRFLADKGVQKLQQVFHTTIDINSIKEIPEVSSQTNN